ncbi:predicted protein [Histoplasma mississippiense (nom. inval.)]|uniref:predicted protein n=1 Tax=Ajellomyces capsulatus (strain NAm1 / WU24) TaxID=2059318 RepID=UPI000157D4AF|nr:predicted protein [Histoplasma mississippiense (nom. inval.)]EDN09167.1 predicted protein [Histoplasma mississippiense (nom. inval.)]
MASMRTKWPSRVMTRWLFIWARGVILGPLDAVDQIIGCDVGQVHRPSGPPQPWVGFIVLPGLDDIAGLPLLFLVKSLQLINGLAGSVLVWRAGMLSSLLSLDLHIVPLFNVLLYLLNHRML